MTQKQTLAPGTIDRHHQHVGYVLICVIMFILFSPAATVVFLVATSAARANILLSNSLRRLLLSNAHPVAVSLFFMAASASRFKSFDACA